MDPKSLPADVPALRHATERLLALLDQLHDDDVLKPSRLPGWTRGHVLTHLARNADGMVNLVTWAVTGKETPMYASREQRDADIDAGAPRPAAAIRADVSASAERLDAAILQLTDEAQNRVVRLGSGAPLPASQIPYGRLREIEIHSVDLGLGYTPAAWAPEFTERTLDVLALLFRRERDTPVTALEDPTSGRRWEVGAAGPTLRGQQGALLAWLTGRSDGDGLRVDPGGPVPPAPRWA